MNLIINKSYKILNKINKSHHYEIGDDFFEENNNTNFNNFDFINIKY